MTLLRYCDWIASGICGFILVGVIKGLMNKAIKNRLLRAFLFVVEFLAMTGLAYLLIADASPFLWKYNYPLSGIYIALLSGCISDLILFFVSFMNKQIPASIKRVVFTVAMLAVFVYGTVNMQIIRENRITYSSEKLKDSYTFVFLSDMHYGSSQSQRTVEKALEQIRDLNADFIVLGGDITDENTEKEEMQWLYQQFSKIDTPVYFIYGNHDRQVRGDYVGGKKYSEKDLEEAILSSGIIILKDEYVNIGDDLVLLGREEPGNPGRLDVSQLKARPEGSYVICIEHVPYQNEDIISTAADLQVSGHTHAGQYFPLKTLYALAGLNVYGKYRIGNADLFVSPGISGWGMPYRNEVCCSYEVIELHPKQ